MTETYYRVDIQDHGGSYLVLKEYKVAKRTEKGCWIYLWDDAPQKGGWRFILDGKGRRFAYNNIEDAMDSFRIRKRKQIAHCERSIGLAKDGLALAKGDVVFPDKPQQDILWLGRTIGPLIKPHDKLLGVFS